MIRNVLLERFMLNQYILNNGKPACFTQNLLFMHTYIHILHSLYLTISESFIQFYMILYNITIKLILILQMQ